MSLDPNGLRRRSPNPNSPIPYSPALLSPYIPHLQDRWSRAQHESSENSGRARYLTEGQTPTIRLVQPPESTDAVQSFYAPQQLRTRSDDQHYRASTIASSVPSLRRHGTDPKSYPSTGRYRNDMPVGEDGRFVEKPVPPLPLNPRKDDRAAMRASPSIGMDDRQSRYTGSRSGSSTPYAATSRYITSPSTPSRSIFSSLKSLHNPFSNGNSGTADKRRKNSRPLSPTASVRSSRTSSSWRSGSSRSSTSTLAVPFYTNSFWKGFGKSTGSVDSVTMEKMKGSGMSEKITDKFPGRLADEGKKERWTGLKVVLLFSILSVLGYGFAGLFWSLSILLRIRTGSDVTMVSDPDVVIFLLLASLLCIFSAMVGLTGVLLNSRPILAFYNLLLWPTLLSMCLVGYTSYKRGNLQIDRKLNQTWSQFLDDEQRLRIQNSLRCCGYFTPTHDATYSKKCYPRTLLPGCKGRWTLFERQALHEFATAAFSTIPFHLVNIAIALLCSNHVNKTFGKGLTPPHYRLRMADVRSNALAVLASLPSPSKPASLHRQPAIYHRPHRTQSIDTTPGSRAPRPPLERYTSSDTLTETVDMKRTRSRQGWVGEVMQEAGPRGRALREARDRGLI